MNARTTILAGLLAFWASIAGAQLPPCSDASPRTVGGRFEIDGAVAFGVSVAGTAAETERAHWSSAAEFPTDGRSHLVVRSSDCTDVLAVVKVLDGCSRNGHYWVSISPAAFNPQMDFGVTDLETGQQVIYQKLSRRTEVTKGGGARPRPLRGGVDSRAFRCE